MYGEGYKGVEGAHFMVTQKQRVMGGAREGDIPFPATSPLTPSSDKDLSSNITFSYEVIRGLICL